MTAEIINLRQARKARERAKKDAQADENRAKFGTSKSERERLEALRARAAKLLDGAQRTPAMDKKLSPQTPSAKNSPAGDEDPFGGGAA